MDLKTHLEQCAALGSKIDRFVLGQGQSFKPDAATFKGRRGKRGHCYRNATLKALASFELTYCEGYVLIYGVPIHHGWCVTVDGKVIDPTLLASDGDRVTEYYGVPFTSDFLLKAANINGYYGILGYASKTQWMLVDGELNSFKRELEAA